METSYNDIRKVEPAARKQLRASVLRMNKRGRKPCEIAEDLGVRVETVRKWIWHMNNGGSIEERQRGRRMGTGRILTEEHEAEIQQLIRSTTPEEHGIPFALWTARAVCELIRLRCRCRVAIRTTRTYLYRWGYTPQRPTKRAVEQNPAAVQRWRTEEYPAIVARSKEENAEIYWGDETGISSQDHAPRGYAPQGQTPVVIHRQARRSRITMISAISRQGTLRFMLYEETLNARIFIRFVSRLIRDAQCKVYLILDNLRVHHTNPASITIIEAGLVIRLDKKGYKEK